MVETSEPERASQSKLANAERFPSQEHLRQKSTFWYLFPTAIIFSGVGIAIIEKTDYRENRLQEAHPDQKSLANTPITALNK